MTYADLTETVLALSGGLLPGADPAGGYGTDADATTRLSRTHGAAAAFAAALTRILSTVARRLPDVETFYIMPPVAAVMWPGKRDLHETLALNVPAVRGLSCRCRGRGTVTLGERTVHVAREELLPLCLIAGEGELIFAPDAGETLTIYDLTLFSDPGHREERLPLLCGDEMAYDLTRLCPRFAMPLSVGKPARVTADTLFLPRDCRLPVPVTAALYPPVVTADDVLAENGRRAVPVPTAAQSLLALGMAADLYAAESDLPAEIWRAQFEAGLAALPRCAMAESIFDRKGWAR